MHGVDLADQLCESLKFPLRARFWYRTLIVYGLDTCVCNALKLSNAVRASRGYSHWLKRQEAQFTIARHLLLKYGGAEEAAVQPSLPAAPSVPELHSNWQTVHAAQVAAAPPVDVGVFAHVGGAVVQGASRKCAAPGCRARGHFGYTGCGVVLCFAEC